MTFPSPTKFGRFQVPESPSSLMRLHFYSGAPLRIVDHEPKVEVLDQEDLFDQGIHVSQFIPGAQDVDALGSCTAQATTAALSNVLSQRAFCKLTGSKSYADTTNAEKWAIQFYHICTDQTGDPSQEWPPTDCGSSGPYIVSELERMKLIKSERIAHGAQNIVSLLQSDGILMGSPWFNSWMQPNSSGFIDGGGSAASLQTAIASGVAGGHETYPNAIVKLALTETGVVIPDKTILKGRNSWTKAWGDNGSYLVHLSTLVMLGGHCDFRQLVV